LPVQYADYAVWQRRWIEGEVLRRQAEYWKNTLIGAPALLELPADHARPAQQDFAGDSVGLLLDEELTTGLKALGRRHDTTLFMTVLGSWAVLLARLSGQPEVVIGTPVANRGRREIEKLIGFFVNTLALRVDVSGSPTVGELLDRVKSQTIAAQQHQDIPFEQVVEVVKPVRSLAHSPLFQVMLAWQDLPEGRMKFPGVEIEPLKSAPHMVSRFDLTLSLRKAGDRIVGGVEYATSLFERGTVERYLGYFHSLLEAMVAEGAGTQPIDRLPLLSTEERKQLLYEWNDTAAEYQKEKCVHELFEKQVERTPDAVAVAYEEMKLSYDELNRRANRLARYLRKFVVEPDARVAICVERGLEMVVGLLGVLKAGGAYVPLDPTHPVDRLRYMMRACAPVALLTQGQLEGLFGGMSQDMPVVD
jgi:non-ribosomal peptide synthetase component F